MEKPNGSDVLDDLIDRCITSGVWYSEFIHTVRKKYIENMLLRHKCNQIKAARALGMHRNTLSRTIADLGINLRELRMKVPASGKKRAAPAAKPTMTARQFADIAG